MTTINTKAPLAPQDPTLLRAFSEIDQGLVRPRKHCDILNAGPIIDLPEGGCKIFHHKNLSIGVFKINGRFYAVRNLCPHMGAPLCKGRIGSTYRPSGNASQPFEETLTDRVIRCPWHGWEFDIVTGKGLYDAKGRIPTYQVRINAKNEIEVLI